MTNHDLKNTIEALIFASDFPLSVKKIMEVISDSDEQEVNDSLEELILDFERMERGIKIHKVAGGYEFVSKGEYSAAISKLLAGRRRIIGRA